MKINERKTIPEILKRKVWTRKTSFFQIQRDYNEKLLIHIAETQAIDKDYEDLNKNEDVIKRWVANGMTNPPHKVIVIKNRTTASWKHFKEVCNAIYASE